MGCSRYQYQQVDYCGDFGEVVLWIGIWNLDGVRTEAGVIRTQTTAKVQVCTCTQTQGHGAQTRGNISSVNGGDESSRGLDK
eukprot:scaffold272_cov117-Skeletonema_dohrnii-CCMP3373.AAC.2